MGIKEKIEQLRAARNKADEVIKEVERKLKTAKLSISPQTLKNLIKKLEDTRNGSDIKTIEAAIAEANKAIEWKEPKKQISYKEAPTENNNETYQGILIDFPDKGDCYRGGMKNGKPHGKGEVIYLNKNRFEGDFVNGIFQKGSYYTVNNGNSQVGYYNEQGKWVAEKYNYKNGDWKEGSFDENSKLHGEGIEYYANKKRKDTGEYEHGARIGKGKMEWEPKHWYSGEWNSKGSNGQGEYHFPNGNCQKGNFVNGIFCSGKYSYTDDCYYEGNFDENSKLHGEGTYYDATKKRKYVGTFEHGKRIGKGKIIYLKNGMTEEGEWDDIGVYKGKRTFPDGRIEAIDSL